MSDVYLRYEEEPENKFLFYLSKFFELLKNKVFLLILGLIIALLIIFFVLFPLLTTPGSNFVEIVYDNKKTTSLKSEKGSFYAKIKGETKYAVQKGNSYYVDLGEIREAQKVQTGPFQDFKIFKRPLNSTKDFTVADKFLFNSKLFALTVQKEFQSKNFTYEIESIKKDSDFTIYEDETVVFQEGLPDSKCNRKAGFLYVYECRSSFGDNKTRDLNVSIKNKQNKIIKIDAEKISYFDPSVVPTGPVVAKIDCKFPVEPNIGPNKATCTSTGNADVKVAENSYKFETGKETIITTIGKKGNNSFQVIGTDSNNQPIDQTFPYKVPTNFYLSFNPKNEKYDLTDPMDIEFTINTNENLIFDIYANASDNTKGYTALGSEGIDTDFSYLNTVNLGVASDYTKNGLLVKIKAISEENKTRTPVYPEFLNLDFVIKNESGQTIKAPCKIYLKVNNKAENKSICE